MTWTTERIEFLKSRWGTVAVSTIAAELVATRNAVIGKASRLGLERLKNSQLKGEAHPNWRGGEQVSRKKHNAKNRQRRADERRRRLDRPWTWEAPPAFIPIEQRCDVLNLTWWRCHWPIGDPREAEFYFCGGQAHPGRPYCRGHCSLAWRPGREG